MQVNMMQIEAREVQANIMLARYYGSSLGRFQSPDPVRDSSPDNPQSWNKYTYVRNNPVLLTDPDGRTVTIDKKKFNGTQRLHIKQQINRLRHNKAFNK